MKDHFSIRSCAFITRALLVGLVFIGLASGRVSAIENTHAIEGYADNLSVAPEGTLNFSIHLPSGHTRYAVRIYRYGAQLDGPNSIGTLVAGPFLGTNGQTQSIDANSYVNGANWSVSFSLKVPSASTAGIAPCTRAPLPAGTWKSGIYTARITDRTSLEYFHITFIVKDSDSTRKSIALLASTNTWQAYNFWPGQHLGGVADGSSFYNSCGRTDAETVVSFLRPNPYATPETHDNEAGDCANLPYYRTEHLVAGELRVAYWLESNNRDYSMLSDWDVHSIPGVLDPAVFQTVIISTHSEYWSQAMYNAVQRYLAKGGNVISLSGNTCYWKVTYGHPGGNRTLTKHEIWTPQQQGELLGLGSFGASGIGNAYCAPYGVLLPNHWAFQGIPGQSLIGQTGVILGTSTCGDGNHGAAGWEIDRTGFGDPTVEFHVFAKEFSILGRASHNVFVPNTIYKYQSAEMVHVRRASAGQVLSVGSILFGQSLIVDGPLSNTMLAVLDKFSSRSFSDFNGDGKPDLVARKPDGTLWRYNGNGAGGLAVGVQFSSVFSGIDRLVAAGDVNGDGQADLIGRQTNGSLWLYPGTGTGKLKSPRVLLGTGWNAFDILVAPGDFDDDGYPDLIGRKPDGSLWFYQGTSNGSLITPNASFNSGWEIYNMIVAPGDFDEDGNPDLLALKPDGTLWLYRGNGSGGFVASGTQIGTGFNQFAELITPGDFDGDHHADVLGRKADGTLWLLKGVGNGTFLLNAGTQMNQGWNIFSNVVGVW